MSGCRHGYAVSMENSLELSTTLVHFYQQQRQLGQLLLKTIVYRKTWLGNTIIIFVFKQIC